MVYGTKWLPHSCSKTVASEKSHSRLPLQSFVSSTFASLMSRCTMPLLCMRQTAVTKSRTMPYAASIGGGPITQSSMSFMSRYMSPPCINGIEKANSLGVLYTASMGTMWLTAGSLPQRSLAMISMMNS